MLHLGGRIGDGVSAGTGLLPEVIQDTVARIHAGAREAGRVPEALKAKVQTYVDGYELYDHVLNEGENPRRIEALGLTDYALKRYALAGNPGDWIARIEEIAQAGATQLWVGLGGRDLDRQLQTMRLLGKQIMARFV